MIQRGPPRLKGGEGRFGQALFTILYTVQKLYRLPTGDQPPQIVLNYSTRSLSWIQKWLGLYKYSHVKNFNSWLETGELDCLAMKGRDKQAEEEPNVKRVGFLSCARLFFF